MVFQGVEWVALLREGLTLTSSTARQLLLPDRRHARAARGRGAARAALGLRRLLRGDLVLDRSSLTVEMFWYFVVGLWPILYWRVYL